MIFLQADLSIYKRLTGYPLDAQGRPQLDNNGVPLNREVIGPPDLNPVENTYDPITGAKTPLLPVLPSYGIRIPMMKAPYRAQRGLTSKDPSAIPKDLHDRFDVANFRQIPVFDENITGRKYDDIWPCVTFRWQGTEYESNTYVYHDPFGAPDTSSFQDPTSGAASIRNAQGNVVATGYSQNIVRPHPESWNLIYAITVWSKDQIEMGLICNEVMKLFPGKGAIVFTFQDGSTHACDMLLQRVDNLDVGADNVLQTQGGEEQRGFVRSFVYLIEAYIDNTTNEFGVQGSYWASRQESPIMQRLIEIDDIMTGMVETQSHDFNLDELQPFTPGY